MRNSKTIGKQKVLHAAGKRGLSVTRCVDPADGLRRWKISNRKGFTIWRDSSAEVWLVVMPLPVALPKEEEHEESVLVGDSIVGDPDGAGGAVHAEHGAGGVA
jgi:hypothetical protein